MFRKWPKQGLKYVSTFFASEMYEFWKLSWRLEGRSPRHPQRVLGNAWVTLLSSYFNQNKLDNEFI